MITRSEINETIDTDITNKTGLGSIAPTQHGAVLKTMLDYTDEQIKIKTAKTTITQAQILQLFTTPIAVLSSTTDGIAKIPLNIFCKRNGAGTNYTIESNQFKLSCNSTGATVSLSLSNSILSGPTPVSFTTLDANFNFQVGIGADNETYKLGCYTSNPTAGTGAMDVYVTYIEITL